MTAVVAMLHVVGWVTLLAIVVPGHYSIGTQTFGAGIGITAYTLGARHAFDADHISGHRQHHAQADGGRQAPAQRRVLLLARPLQRRVRAALLLSLGVRALTGPVRNGWSGCTR